MAVTVIDTVGGASSNSYVSEAYASTYVNTYGLTEAVRDVWLNTGADDKARALIIATRDLDVYMVWEGSKATGEQALQWPRTGTDYASDVIPEPLKQATVEFALWRLQNDSPTTDMVAFDSISVGPIKIDYNDNMSGTAKRYVPDIVLTMLQDLGSFDVPAETTTNMMRQVRLVRT